MKMKMKMKMKMMSFSSKACLNMINIKEEEEEHQNEGSSRFLITVNVFGSAGPLRFIANCNDNVAGVISTALKLYAREGRLPVLGSDANCFLLYPANVGVDAFNPSDGIGCHGVRNFVLCKKEKKPNMTEGRSQMIDAKKGPAWRLWLQKSLSLKILPH